MELNEILEAIGFSGDAENLTREKLVGSTIGSFAMTNEHIYSSQA